MQYLSFSVFTGNIPHDLPGVTFISVYYMLYASRNTLTFKYKITVRPRFVFFNPTVGFQPEYIGSIASRWCKKKEKKKPEWLL